MVETVGAVLLQAAGAGGLPGFAGLGTLATSSIAGVSFTAVVGTAAIIGTTIGQQYILSARSTKGENDDNH